MTTYTLVIKTDDRDEAVQFARNHVPSSPDRPAMVSVVPTPHRHMGDVIVKVSSPCDLTDALNEWFTEDLTAPPNGLPVGSLLWWGGVESCQ